MHTQAVTGSVISHTTYFLFKLLTHLCRIDFLSEHISNFRAVWWCSTLERKFDKQCRPNQMPHSAASNLGLYCLPMSHNKDARLSWVSSMHAG